MKWIIALLIISLLVSCGQPCSCGYTPMSFKAAGANLQLASLGYGSVISSS
jgi:hypothetical protein